MAGRGAGPERADAALGLDFAWRVHQAMQEWTRNVDQKASIALVFTTAVGGAVATEVLGREGGLHGVGGLRLWLVWAMAACFAGSALVALSVVLPRLHRRRVRRESGLIYFGHLHQRSSAEIEGELARLTPARAREELARQLETTAAIAWRKHARLQWSLVLLVLAVAIYGVARFAV